MTSQIEIRVVDSLGNMCASSVATTSAGSGYNVDNHRFTLYEDQILQAMHDLSDLLAETCAVS